ncbi:ABC-2 transporter permease [Saccharibacillus alkalitolerans]|uniref:ABC-2 transporter permease n=1 Tax=Saccharibacillus alkalitolerans TaxID=2705290 RepID=A0ABX0F5K0_9BACL|nr:ABC-2 transporter permease [Saccharibacillus alkalitolerans]NGZ75259.1 ABC-2 transporter permease [Saccharibacillus alkalitolerans]
MTGLVTSNFYSMQGNIKLSLMIALPIALVPFLLGDASMIPMIVAIQIFVFASNTGTSLKMDESSKWNKFEITLPVTRTAIVSAKYVSFMLLILLGLATSLVTVLLQSIRGELSFDLLFSGYSFGLQLSLMTIGIVYPLILKLGAEKSETLLFAAAGLSVALRFLLWYLLHLSDATIDFRSSEVDRVSLMVALAIFAASYAVSVMMYRSKELH